MSAHNINSTRALLVDVIGGVRRRWRAKIILRGTLITGVAALILLILTGYGLRDATIGYDAVVAVRVAALLVVIGLAVRYLVLPLRRQVRDEQVALYLEEHEPSLQNVLITALDPDAESLSPAFAHRA